MEMVEGARKWADHAPSPRSIVWLCLIAVCVDGGWASGRGTESDAGQWLISKPMQGLFASFDSWSQRRSGSMTSNSGISKDRQNLASLLSLRRGKFKIGEKHGEEEDEDDENADEDEEEEKQRNPKKGSNAKFKGPGGQFDHPEFERCMVPGLQEQIKYEVTDWCDLGKRGFEAAFHYDSVDDIEQIPFEGCEAKKLEEQFPVIDRPKCSRRCPAGKFLAVDEDEVICKKCPAGTFGTGGGNLISHWPEMPPQFDTKCWSLDQAAYQRGVLSMKEGGLCAPWTVTASGKELHSGDNLLNDSIESMLILHLRFVTKGSLWFRYKVEAEAGVDGFMFFIDSDNTGQNVAHLPFTSTQLDFTTARFEVGPGWHSFKWIYAKDMSASFGFDGVMISEIGWVGTSWSDRYCLSCPEGSTSLPGATRCSACRLNSVYDRNASKCIRCSGDTYALPGFTECRKREKCKVSDYAARYSECREEGNATSRSKRFEWLEPKVCAGGKQLPPEKPSVPCATCSPGTVNKESECEYCKAGSYSPEPSTPCMPCAAGHAAIPSRFYTMFDEWPPEMKTGCSGQDCVTEGWLLRDTHIDPGKDHGRAVEVWLEVEMEMLEGGGSVVVDYEMRCDEGGYEDLVFQVDTNGAQTSVCQHARGRAGWDAKAAAVERRRRGGGAEAEAAEEVAGGEGRRKGRKSLRLEVEGGRHVLRVQYTKQLPEQSAVRPVGEAAAKVWSVRVSGASRGGAFECAPCPPGSFSLGNSARCTPCQAGFSSSEGARSCARCPANTFAPFPGTPRCIPCGANTFSLAGATECGLDCTFSDHQFSFAPPPPLPNIDMHGKTDMDDIDPAKMMLMMPEPSGTLSRIYDLGPLRDAADTLTLTLPVANPVLGRKEEREVVLSVCHPLPPSTPCMAPAAHLPPHTYACSQPPQSEGEEGSVQLSREVLALGSLMGFDRLQLNLQHRYHQGVTVRYDLGEECEVQGGTAGVWSVVIHVVCNLNAGVGQPRNATDEEIWAMVDGPCQVHLIWESQHGCVLCKDEDYAELGGDCVAGRHDVTFTRNHLCYSGKAGPPPPLKAVGCRTQVLSALSPAAFYALVAGLSTVALTMGSLGYCYLRYKRMYGEYSQVLASDDDGVPYGNSLEEDNFTGPISP